MTNDQSIAAILAANTPLKAARYAVDNPPAAEIARLLDQAVEDHDTINALRRQLAVAREAIGAARALLHEIDAGGQYPHSGFMIGIVLMQLEKALKMNIDDIPDIVDIAPEDQTPSGPTPPEPRTR